MSDINVVIDGKYKGCAVGMLEAYLAVICSPLRNSVHFCQPTVKDIEILEVDGETGYWAYEKADPEDLIYTADIIWQDGEKSTIRVSGVCFDNIVYQVEQNSPYEPFLGDGKVRSKGFGGGGGGSFGLGEAAGIFTGLKIGGFFD